MKIFGNRLIQILISIFIILIFIFMNYEKFISKNFEISERIKLLFNNNLNEKNNFINKWEKSINSFDVSKE